MNRDIILTAAEIELIREVLIEHIEITEHVPLSTTVAEKYIQQARVARNLLKKLENE